MRNKNEIADIHAEGVNGFFDLACERDGRFADKRVRPVKDWDYDLLAQPAGAYCDGLLECGGVERIMRTRSGAVHSIKTGEPVVGLVAWRRA